MVTFTEPMNIQQPEENEENAMEIVGADKEPFAVEMPIH